MSEIKIGIYNHETGINEIRNATPEEIEIYTKANEEVRENQKINEQKEKIRLSALAKLAALGLTSEEIAAL